MIEKIQVTRFDNDLATKTLEAINKVNELVDAANKHEDIIRQIGEWGSNKGECLWCENLTKVNLADPFAKQRKWEGKLCWFWDEDYDLKTVGVFKEITTIEGKVYYAKKGIRTVWKHCEPVLPTDNAIYKGGDND